MHWKRTVVTFIVLAFELAVLGWLTTGREDKVTAESDCSTIYSPGNGWAVELCGDLRQWFHSPETEC
jgi:hypothetical protein